jgi:hypothetical protein
LSDDQIRELVRIGTTAPTSFHMQNWRFIPGHCAPNEYWGAGEVPMAGRQVPTAGGVNTAMAASVRSIVYREPWLSRPGAPLPARFALLAAHFCIPDRPASLSHPVGAKAAVGGDKIIVLAERPLSITYARLSPKRRCVSASSAGRR